MRENPVRYIPGRSGGQPSSVRGANPYETVRISLRPGVGGQNRGCGQRNRAPTWWGTDRLHFPS